MIQKAANELICMENKAQWDIVLKIGSNVIAGADGLPDLALLESLVSDVARYRRQGTGIILVSSGAVASGRSFFSFPKKPDPVAGRQVLASLGQIKLMGIYAELFAKEGLFCAQVLVTKEDFRDRIHYLNIRNCLQALLANGIVPVVNENDVVSVTELMFTDNDELAGLVAAMMDVDALFVLTNVDGVLDAPPGTPGSKPIPVIGLNDTGFGQFVTAGKSGYGRGGMLTKCAHAKKTASLGIATVIANGKKPGILQKLMESAPGGEGTYFLPRKKASGIKKWLAHTGGSEKGQVCINQGAAARLLSDQASSLLPVGLVQVDGDFKKGDIVRILGQDGKNLGLGIAKYGAAKARELMGLPNQPPLFHYDHLFVFQEALS